MDWGQRNVSTVTLLKVHEICIKLHNFFFVSSYYVFLVPPKITKAPDQKLQFNIEENENLTCNASGDPHPNITWTKDGIPVNQFNVSGYLLHLVKVQRKDAGSYRCTASNGYGSDATSVSIVGIKCTSKYTILWKIAIYLGLLESILSKILMWQEVTPPFTKNGGKEIFKNETYG